jgi:hypothetical protein
MESVNGRPFLKKNKKIIKKKSKEKSKKRARKGDRFIYLLVTLVWKTHLISYYFS